MTLEQLRIFTEVAARLHFTQAAAALGLTQSAVSAAVAALEAGTGIPLFHRIGRRVTLTAEGLAFLPEAQDVLRAARRATEAADQLAGLERGHVTIHGSQTVATYWLPPLLHRFRQRHPGIVVSLGIGNTAQVAEAVAAGDAELGVVEGEFDFPSLLRRPVAEDHLTLVVGPGHVWAAAAPVAADTLRRLPWVLREPGSGTRATCEALWARSGLTPADMNVALELPSNEAVRSAVEAGAGATILSLLVADASLKAGLLHACPCPLPRRRFTLLRHPDRRPGRAAVALMAGMGASATYDPAPA